MRPSASLCVHEKSEISFPSSRLPLDKAEEFSPEEMAHKDVQRRTWDKAEFEARAREREATERAGRTYKTKEELEKEATKGERESVRVCCRRAPGDL